MVKPRLVQVSSVLAVLFFAPLAALFAATYLDMGDVALTDSAPAIAVVQVRSAETAFDQEAVTRYRVEVLHGIKALAAGEQIEVRLPGGTTTDGMTLRLPGIPSFQVGQQLLLFLSPGDDGAWGVHQLALGAFARVPAGDRWYAMRDLSEANVIGSGTTQVRDFDRFVGWLDDHVSGRSREIDYLEQPSSEMERMADAYTLFTNSGKKLRWQVFDTAGQVSFRAHTAGQPGLAGGGYNEFKSALQAWTNDPQTPIKLTYGGTTSAMGGLTTFDSINALLFNDPNNLSDFGGAFSCSTGGVIAIGGPWFATSTTHMHNGESFITIQGADLVTNKNTGCILGNPLTASEVFAHELGHTIGVDHSCGDTDSGACNTTKKDQALMRAFVHADGRGAQLGADDRDAIAFLYGQATTPTPDPCKPNATTLCLADGRFKVTVTWKRSNGETGSGTGVKLTNDTGYFWFFQSINVEMVVKVLRTCNINNRFWVFAGGLTAVEVTMRVTDTDNGTVKIYKNPQNKPFQPIQDTQAFATCP